VNTEEIKELNFLLERDFEKKDFQSALEKLDKLIAFSENKSAYYHAKGVALKFLNKNLEALKFFTEAAKKDPNNPHIAEEIGILHTREKNFEEAAKYFAVCIKNNHNIDEICLKLADIYYNLGQLEKSYECLLQVKNVAKDADISHRKAVLLKAFNESPLALKFFTEAAKKDPGNPHLAEETGVLHERKKNFTEAIKYFAVCIKNNHNTDEIYLKLANIYSELKQFEKSYECFLQIKNSGENAGILHRMAMLLKVLKRNSEALKLFARAAEKDPNNPQIAEGLGMLYEREKNFSEAAKYFTVCANNNHQMHETYFRLANAYLKLGDMEKYCECFFLFRNRNGSDCEFLSRQNTSSRDLLLDKEKAIIFLNLADKILIQNARSAELVNDRFEISKNLFLHCFDRNQFHYDNNVLLQEYEMLKRVTPLRQQDLYYLMRISNYFGKYDQTLQILSAAKINIDDIFYQNAILAESEIASKTIRVKCKPRCIWVVLSSKCNINCIMCETHSKKWELDDEEIQKIVAHFPYLEQLTWWGGEPTVHAKFLPLLKKALEYPRIKQTIITNGQHIPEELIEILKQNNSIDFVFSIDYIEKDTYERIRRGASFDKLIKNLETVKSIGTSARMNAVLMDTNSKDEDIDKFEEFGRRYNLSGVTFLSVGQSASNRAPEHDLLNVERRRVTRTDGNFIVQPSIMPDPAAKKDASAANAAPNNASCIENHNEQPKAPEPAVMCHTPWYQLTLDYNKVFSSDKNCLCFHNSDTTIENSNYLDAWNSTFMTSLRRYIVEHSACHEKCSRYR